ncbi:UDP-N-acetylmuramoyl-L-alanine--D-glutamate ligase [Lactovum odontotermitis]
MKNSQEYKAKHVLVLGLERSGTAAAKLLHELGAEVVVNDAAAKEAPELESLGIKVVTGSHPLELLDGIDLMVKNPGIRYDNVLVAAAETRGIPVITDIELAGQLSEAPIAAITGTNGKTTTTTLIGRILCEAGLDAKVAGNIGVPASEVVAEINASGVLVLETSSFQLMGTRDFHPHIAVITNIYSTHLDYHGSQANYEAAKWNIQKNMTAEDFLILNFNQEKMRDYAEKTQATVVPFSTQEVLTQGAYLLDGKLYFQGEYILDAAELSLPGEHNVENALAAIAAVKLQGADNAAIIKVLTTFEGVRHRLQFLGTAHGRRAYNDTEATNILATKKALTGFNHSKLWLFAGGLDRGNDFDELEPSLIGLKGLVISGQTTPKFVALAEKMNIPYITTENVVTGLNEIFPRTEPGDTLLLSPACASWDQYKDAEQRGDMFIEAFDALKETVE